MADVLVVGISGGVGLAVGRALIDHGYDVHGSVLNDTEVGAVRAALPDAGKLVTLDLSNADHAIPVLQQFLADTSMEPRAIIVCSGIAPFGPLETTPLSSLRRALEINTVACVAVYQACLPALRRTKGRLVLVGSMAGKVGMPFLGQYVATKFALEGLADVMRQEAHKWGVGVALIEPGGVQTPMVDNEIAGARVAISNLSDRERADYGRLYQQFVARLETSYANCILPSEVAAAILEVIEADALITRRQVGADSVRMCEAARTATDEDRDAMFRTAYQGALDPE